MNDLHAFDLITWKWSQPKKEGKRMPSEGYHCFLTIHPSEDKIFVCGEDLAEKDNRYFYILDTSKGVSFSLVFLAPSKLSHKNQSKLFQYFFCGKKTEAQQGGTTEFLAGICLYLLLDSLPLALPSSFICLEEGPEVQRLK